MEAGLNKGWRRRLGPGLLLAGAACGALALLYFFSPAEQRFFPRCWLYALTGWQCPGCGGLRAMHELLHGHWTAAWRLNPLVLAGLPVAVGWAAGWLVRRWTGREVWAPFRHPAWAWAVLAVLVAFGVLRNVPIGRLAGLME